MAQELQGSGLHIFVSLKHLSSTCRVTFLAASATDHKHKFSRTHLIYFSCLFDSLTFLDQHFPCDVPRQSGGSKRIPSLTGYELKSVETKATETRAIESGDLEPKNIELDKNLGTDPYQIQERFMRNDYQNPITEDVNESGKVGAEMSYLQSQIHSDYDSAESIADWDLEDGELRKMLASLTTVLTKSRGL